MKLNFGMNVRIETTGINPIVMSDLEASKIRGEPDDSNSLNSQDLILRLTERVIQYEFS